ncbi:hypothetical protein DPMN_161910 [Dreissena polymorpha]|uniref:Uncharacterized protein n=1 Tax=Dreissena polymorpha TaxID=45954 RepID=A0A9D4ETW0_DREPO|nr:hypothetical protein DPMN_161910 [Dreissena polymorpha]
MWHSPMGTCESYTTSPTFDHFPIGSRFTPRLINACARSLRRVFSVFVRIVTGRGTSLDSRKSMIFKQTRKQCQGF